MQCKASHGKNWLDTDATAANKARFRELLEKQAESTRMTGGVLYRGVPPYPPRIASVRVYCLGAKQYTVLLWVSYLHFFSCLPTWAQSDHLSAIPLSNRSWRPHVAIPRSWAGEYQFTVETTNDKEIARGFEPRTLFSTCGKQRQHTPHSVTSLQCWAWKLKIHPAINK